MEVHGMLLLHIQFFLEVQNWKAPTWLLIRILLAVIAVVVVVMSLFSLLLLSVQNWEVLLVRPLNFYHGDKFQIAGADKDGPKIVGYFLYVCMCCNRQDIMQEKYEKAMISLAQMEKRAVMAESMLEATLQYESGQNKAHQSPGYINDSHNITLCLHVHSFLPRCPLFAIHHVFWIVAHKMDSCIPRCMVIHK